MDKQTRETASRLFSALSNPTRIRIVELLACGELPVNEIADSLGIGQSGTSQHLAILSRTGVLAVEQRGASRYYRLRGPRIPQILNLIQEFCKVHKLRGTETVGETVGEDVAVPTYNDAGTSSK